MAFFRLFALIFRHFAWRISFFRLFAWRYFVFSLFRLAFFRYFVFSLGVISSWRRAITPGEKTKERNNEMAQTSHHSLPTTWTSKVMSNITVPGRVAQSVTCLATDACLTADPGIASSIPVRSHTFVEIESWNNFYGHSPPFRWFIQEGLLSVTSESMCTNYWLTACSCLPRKKVWLGELTVPQWP